MSETRSLPFFEGDICNRSCPQLNTYDDVAECRRSSGELSWESNPVRGLRIFRSSECKASFPQTAMIGAPKPERIKSTMEHYADDASEAVELKDQLASLQSENSAVLLTLARLGAKYEHALQQIEDLQAAGTSAVLERRANDLTLQVTEFHNAFGYPVRHRVTDPTPDEAALRLRLITEEFLELLEAHGAPALIRREIWERVTKWVEFQRGGPGFNIDHVAVADALGDIDFVGEGTRLTYGIPRQEVANEISRSNNEKKGGTIDPQTGKLGKPLGWTPPDIKGILDKWNR